MLFRIEQEVSYLPPRNPDWIDPSVRKRALLREGTPQRSLSYWRLPATNPFAQGYCTWPRRSSTTRSMNRSRPASERKSSSKRFMWNEKVVLKSCSRSFRVVSYCPVIQGYIIRARVYNTGNLLKKVTVTWNGYMYSIGSGTQIFYYARNRETFGFSSKNSDQLFQQVVSI